MSAPQSYADQLQAAGRITEAEHAALTAPHPFALGGELRVVLFVSVSLFVGGAGVLIYDNIDTIGHLALLGILAALCLGCYAYAFKASGPVVWGHEPKPGLPVDYAILLGALLLAVLAGYAQTAYAVFGKEAAWAAFAIALMQLATAYRFGHAGVLSLAITAFAAWLGLSVAPAQMLDPNNLFSGHPPDYLRSSLLLTLACYGACQAERRFRARPHFQPTYLYIAVLVGLVSFVTAHFMEDALVYRLVFSLAVPLFYLEARRVFSPTILMAVILASYIVFTKYVLVFLDSTDTWALAMLYVGGSGIGCIWLITHYRTLLRRPAPAPAAPPPFQASETPMGPDPPTADAAL